MRTIYLIWPDGETPDKCYSFENVAVYDKARDALDAKAIRYGHAVVPVLGDEDTLNYLLKEMVK